MAFLEKVVAKFREAASKQEEKGIAKYGHEVQPLDPKWDWLNMAEEELIDGYKYLVAERERRDHYLNLAIRNIRNIQSICTDELAIERLDDVVESLKRISKNV